MMPLAEALLRTDGLSKAYGAVVACDAVTLAIEAGEIHAVIGPNGAGKSTLIGLIAGEIAPNAGAILFDGKDIVALPIPERARQGIGRSFQITSVLPSFTAGDNVALAVLAKSGHCFRFWRPTATDASLRRPAMEVLAQVGLADRAAVPAAELSHGEQRQLEIAMALAGSPRLLLLDEPTAGMGREETESLIQLLSDLRRTVTIILVEHDMDAVFALADRITVMLQGRVIATGAPAEIRANDQVRQAYLGEDIP